MTYGRLGTLPHLRTLYFTTICHRYYAGHTVSR